MDKRKKVGFVGLMLVNFLVMFLISGVGVYSYTVASQFHSMSSVSMIFALECAARSVTIPLGGKLGDKIGHKKLFLGALAFYIVSYAVASFATNFWVFTIARMFSGFAWGLFIMNVFVLISALFGQDQAPKYSGFNQSLTTVAMIVAAPITGLLCAVNWRLGFWISLPLLVIGFALCAYGIPDIPKSEQKTSFDTFGIIATAIMLIPFSLAMNFGNINGWTSPLVLTLFALTLIGLILLVIAEKKAEDPVFPVRLFKNRPYLIIVLLAFAYNLLNGSGNYMPSYAQAYLGVSSQAAGLLMVPGLIISVILTSILGSQAAKTGRYKGMVTFWVIASLAGSIIWFFLGNVSGKVLGLILLIGGSLPISAVMSVNQIAPYTYPMKVLKPEDLATGLAFVGLAGALSSSISGGICGALMNGASGMSAVFKLPLVCAVIMVVLSLFFKDKQ